jgi:hypothetical protein
MEKKCEHSYNPNHYSQDDQGFYLNCIHCGHLAFFDCNSEDELFEIFGLNDDDWDDHDEEE